METELNRNIRVLCGMIERTPAGAEREALVAAYNRLVSDRWRAEAGKRKPEEWPFCEICGRPFAFALTDNDCLHTVYKDCKCEGGVVFGYRPFVTWGKWEERARENRLS